MNWKLLSLGLPLAAALVACPAPVTPSYTLDAPSPTSLTFTKPSTGSTSPQIVTVSITPSGGFSSDLTATLVGPSGVSATPVTIPAGATSAQLGVIASSTATVGADQAYTVQTSGGGVDPQTQPLKITVNAGTTPPPPPAPNFTVAATTPAAVTKPASGTVMTTSTVTVTPSNGFTGAVVITAAPTITGVTFSPLTITIPSGGTSAVTGTLAATVSSSAAVATTAVTVTGTGTISGASAARTATPVNLTVNAAAPVLTTITITSPTTFTAANNKLNLGVPTTFTAAGKDQFGNPFTPTTPITWTSSVPATVSIVSATGVATAQQLSTTPVTLTATSGSVSASVSVVGVYSFAASLGTQSGFATGAAYIVKIQNPSGVKYGGNSNTVADITVTGPSGFGTAGSAKIPGTEFSWDASNDFGVLRAPPGTAPTALMSGAYTMTTMVGTDTYTTGSMTVDATQTLPAPTNVTFSPAPQPAGAQTTTVSWTAVPGALSYRVVVLKAGFFQSFTDVTGTSASVGFTGASADSFTFLVIAYNADIISSDPTLPAQFNVSSTQSSTYDIP